MPLPVLFFFFNDTAPTEIYTLSLHDALPIYTGTGWAARPCRAPPRAGPPETPSGGPRNTARRRSEEHTSELQSHVNLVCRLLLEKKKSKPTQALPVSGTTHSPASPLHPRGHP